MVNFSVFNELSLPLRELNEFEEFFKILTHLRDLRLEKIRMDKPFAQYNEILPNLTFQQLIGNISDRDKKRRLLNFIKDGITVIESPLILHGEEENEQLLENEYFYNNVSTIGALACCDIWNTVTISFNSKIEWNKDYIVLQKQNILDEQEIDIDIRHASKVQHLNSHQNFFKELEEDIKLGITQDNFWDNREEVFSQKIIFSKEVEKQIQAIDTAIFRQAMGLLLDIEMGRKLLSDYSFSGESQSVKDDENLKKYRYFTINDKKVYFNNHIKSLAKAHRIYFLEQDAKIYIGYIGKHLPTKKF